MKLHHIHAQNHYVVVRDDSEIKVGVKMKKSILLLLASFVLLTGCGPQANIIGDVESSKIIIDERRDLITFYVRIVNDGGLPSDTLYAKFEIQHEGLAQELGEDVIVFVNSQQVPQSFSIQGNSGFFIGESFEYTGEIPIAELAGAVEVVIFDVEGEDVTRFLLEKVEEERDE